MSAERILTTAVLAYIHVCYVVFLFFIGTDFWRGHGHIIVSAITPHIVASVFLTLALVLYVTVNKRSDLRVAVWKRIMLASALVLTVVMLFVPTVARVREYAP